MTSGKVSARDGACSKMAARKARVAAAWQRKVVLVLNGRALGGAVEALAHRTGLAADEVRKVLNSARLRGDRRALTDKQAAAVKAPAPWAPEPVTSPARVSVPCVIRHNVGPGVKWDRIGVYQRAASRVSESHPHAAAGFLHLADLFEHCPTFYPSLKIPSDGTSAAETRMRFPNAIGSSTGGGPALACASA